MSAGGISFGIVPPASGVLGPHEEAVVRDHFADHVELPEPCAKLGSRVPA